MPGLIICCATVQDKAHVLGHRFAAVVLAVVASRQGVSIIFGLFFVLSLLLFVAAPAITFSPHSPVAGRSRGGRTTSNPDELTDRTQFARARGLVWTSLCLRHSKQSLAGSPLVHEQC